MGSLRETVTFLRKKTWKQQGQTLQIVEDVEDFAFLSFFRTFHWRFFVVVFSCFLVSLLFLLFSCVFFSLFCSSFCFSFVFIFSFVFFRFFFFFDAKTGQIVEKFPL